MVDVGDASAATADALAAQYAAALVLLGGPAESVGTSTADARSDALDRVRAYVRSLEARASRQAEEIAMHFGPRSAELRSVHCEVGDALTEFMPPSERVPSFVQRCVFAIARLRDQAAQRERDAQRWATLAPLLRLWPGGGCVHVEAWIGAPCGYMHQKPIAEIVDRLIEQQVVARQAGTRAVAV